MVEKQDLCDYDQHYISVYMSLCVTLKGGFMYFEF